jgi:hypothetical protein
MKGTYKTAIVAFALFAFAIIVNVFRAKLLGIVAGSASSNFGFNISFFIPVTLLSVLLALYVLVRTMFSWRKWAGLKMKIVSLGLTLPIVLLSFYQVFRILRSH